LLLEYGVSSAAVSVGWAQYLNELFSDLFGFRMPDAILAAPGEGGFLNFPAIVLVTLCCLLLMRGARESATVNAVMVIIKIAVLIFFVIIAFTAFSGEHFVPFAPFGIAGIGAAASSIFFTLYPSQVGYSAERLVAEQWRAQAEEAQNRALATLPEDVPVEANVISGRNWEEALDSLPWEEGEVLVVGSSRLGPVKRVFLGSNSTKIVRSSPVPVVLIPRGADVHLAEETTVARNSGPDR